MTGHLRREAHGVRGWHGDDRETGSALASQVGQISARRGFGSQRRGGSGPVRPGLSHIDLPQRTACDARAVDRGEPAVLGLVAGLLLGPLLRRTGGS
jgi:hypothetical protein